jgi:hypothetical protein
MKHQFGFFDEANLYGLFFGFAVRSPWNQKRERHAPSARPVSRKAQFSTTAGFANQPE